MTPNLGLSGQGSLFFRMGLSLTSIVRSLWSFRDLILSQRPCSDMELAAVLASAPMLCIEAKIALLAWVLIVASWINQRSLPGLKKTTRQGSARNQWTSPPPRRKRD
jgi:hypothetical protein